MTPRAKDNGVREAAVRRAGRAATGVGPVGVASIPARDLAGSAGPAILATAQRALDRRPGDEAADFVIVATRPGRAELVLEALDEVLDTRRV
jgi:hypothetical protein